MNNKATDTKNTVVETYLELGDYFLEKDWYKQAIGFFVKAIELDSNCGKAYERRGIAYGYVCEYRDAIADFIMAIKFDETYERSN